ncbi:MAG TPA: DUF2061 domain-containing protein [Chitinophagales bacterium]|nr:DUF2061 domain-containing protein [Chitinophagales bacterium]
MPDTKTRSIIKGITWRIIGTLDTIFLSWLITNDVSKAMKIGGFEVFTKSILYFIHERVWLFIGKRRKQDSRFTSFAKAVSWRIVGTLDTIIISFLVIRLTASDEQMKVPAIFQASTIGLAELFTKILLFYIHERAWNRVDYGKGS